MSLLFEYEQRTSWKYEPISGSFHTHEGLAKKVNPDGSYAPFAGSTVVFRTDIYCQQIIALMQKVLFHNLNGSDMLASVLPAYTAHMTLHDLFSPDINGNIPDSLKHASSIVQKIQREYAGRKLTMKADRIVNMVSKALVLILKPQTEEDYSFLLELYHRFDSIQKLPYPLTPHITLGYFKPGMLDGNSLGKAVDSAQIHPENAPIFEFYPESLTAQYFADMQYYTDIPMKICFCCDGGLNRSVMTASIVNHMAKEQNLPIICEARSAYPNTQGKAVSEQVWSALESNGIFANRTHSEAKYLERCETSHFTAFVAISSGALQRFSILEIPDERNLSSFFYGIPDPEYGAVSYADAFRELYWRVEKFIDVMKTHIYQ